MFYCIFCLNQTVKPAHPLSALLSPVSSTHLLPALLAPHRLYSPPRWLYPPRPALLAPRRLYSPPAGSTHPQCSWAAGRTPWEPSSACESGRVGGRSAPASPATSARCRSVQPPATRATRRAASTRTPTISRHVDELLVQRAAQSYWRQQRWWVQI